MRRIGAPADMAAGLFFAATAGLGLWLTLDLRVGTATRMGPGYFPRLICWLLLPLGFLIAGRALVSAGPPLERWHARPLASVLAALLVFSTGIERLGLFVTIVLAVIVAGFGTPEARWREVLAAAFILAAFSSALFIAALGLPLSAWPRLPVF